MLEREKRKGGRGMEGGLAASRLSHLVPRYSPALYSSSEKRQQAFTLDEDRKREGEQQPGQVRKTGKGKRRERGVR